MQSMRRRAAVVLASVAIAMGLVSTPAAQAVVPPPPSTWAAECPATLHCVVDPAAYVANGGDVTDYGNYDITDRPSEMSIDSIIIHDTEGTCQAAIDHFKDPKAYVSTHYVICKDGTVIQMVQTKNFAWHVANWWMNGHSIGIEHEGHAAAGDYTYAQYRASAELAKYLSARFNIPRDRSHILGHDNVMAAPNSALATMHTDPGPYWNWAMYMTMVSGLPSLPSAWESNFVTVAPTWPLSKQPVTGCAKDDPTSCVTGGPRPTNFVYLRSEPRDDAPLINDVVMGIGSTEVANNAARVFYGQMFALAEAPRYDPQGAWYRIYVNGGTGWFRSPWNALTGLPVADSKVKYVTPKPEKGDLPVYARPIPDKSEVCTQDPCEFGYPAEVITAPSPGSFWIKDQQPLPYTLRADQKYTVIDLNPRTDYYYAWSSDGSNPVLWPGEHRLYEGATKYLGIQFGGHVAYVKKDYVDCHNC